MTVILSNIEDVSEIGHISKNTSNAYLWDFKSEKQKPENSSALGYRQRKCCVSSYPLYTVYLGEVNTQLNTAGSHVTFVTN